MPHRTNGGNLEFSEEEVTIARAAMLLAIFFRNEVAAPEASVQTITGVPLSRIVELMNELDELTGHNDEMRRFISRQLQRLSILSDSELARKHSEAIELMNAASRYRVIVSPDLLRRVKLSYRSRAVMMRSRLPPRGLLLFKPKKLG